jgi:aspartate/methionine/tyrosine aminotransferase
MIIAPAKRLESISEYYFSTKLEQIRRMNEAGLDVINLGIGSPDLAPEENVIKTAAAQLKSPKNHGYPSYRSLPVLREAMAAWYERTYEVQIDPASEVLPLLGSKEGLFYIAMAFLNSGDEVLVPNPGYPAYTSVAALAGATAVPYELKEENNFWPDFTKLEQTDLKKVKLMFVNYPHMPTGAAGSEEVFKKLIDFGRKHKILICHDNPYSQVLNSEKPLSILKFDLKMETSLELNSCSKAFNMAGWRVGMLMGSKDVVETVLKVKTNVDSGMFLPVQFGAIEALKATDVFHEQRNSIYRERQQLAYKVFEKIGFTARKNQVGLFLWAKAPASVSSVEARIDEILQKTNVFLTPGFIFGSEGARYARASLCAPAERLVEALARLEKL